MKLTNLRVNHFTTPLGHFLGRPIFSWVAQDTPDKKQDSAQVTVHTSDGAKVYDSGRRGDISSLGFEAPIELLPRTRYVWAVTVWGDGGDSATAGAWFETAKEDEPWQAKWIAADMDKEQHPLLRKAFSLSGEVKSARAYACGVGIYELYVNGKKAGDEYLLPGYHCYDANLEYQTFDVTALLQKGENALGLALGPGWYKGEIVFDRYKDLYGDTMQAICELHVEFTDGTSLVINSDETWESLPSPVEFSNIYDGEVFDARKAVPQWAEPGCAAPSSGVEVRQEGRPLVARFGPKIVKKQEFAPVEIITTPKGETVLDFGQNMTGWVEFHADEPEGMEIKLSYSEVMQEGCFYRDNLRSAKCEYTYISGGKPARARPHFTFYGFRFVKVEGVKNVKPQDFTACHIRSDIDPIGSMETDNPRVNRLFQNAMWGQFDNFLDVPTDCPQRDERLGWTGDAAIISATACKNIYMPAFFHHFVVNLAHEEKAYGGAVPFFVPSPKVAHEDKPQSWVNNNEKGCAIWSDVATMMPWAVYENYGDVNLLRREYDVMKTWVERIRKDDRLDGDRGLWLRGEQLGDWLALDKKTDLEHDQDPFGATDLQYTASCFYYYSTSLTAKAAKALGYAEDAADYEALAEKIRAAVIGEYFNPDGSFKMEGTQTACVLSLYFGIFPEGKKDAVLAQLIKRIEGKNWHLDTGFCGTPFLCRVLSDNGANDVAYTLFLNDDFPSWLYEVKMGATTIWERWNSILPDGSISGTGMNSLNHYAYGSIADWMYRNMAGISPCEEAPGYKRAAIRPMPDPRIRFVEMGMDTAAGRYEVCWRYDGEALRYDITVPFDCEADLLLPDGRTERLGPGRHSF